MEIVISVVVLTVLGVLFGMGLSFAHKIFRVEEDPRVAKILEYLPGSNCGACGLAGCHAAAEALAKGAVDINICAPNPEQNAKEIAALLGKDHVVKVKKAALVFCDGGPRAVDKFEYHGISSCQADISFMQGHKACTYACVGQGDCVRACPFDALKIIDGLPVTDEDKCTACGKCVKACPRHLFHLVPKTAGAYVKCSSRDKGAVVRSVCKSGCTACGICVKRAPSAFKMEDNLAYVYDYSKDEGLKEAVSNCPTKVIKQRS